VAAACTADYACTIFPTKTLSDPVIILGWTWDGIRTSLARPLATAGPADRAGASQPEEVEHAAPGSFDLCRLRFYNSYIGCPEHRNPLQQFVLVLGGTVGAQIHFSIDVLLLTPATGNGWPSEPTLSSLNPV
jgi:hypothetical protein